MNTPRQASLTSLVRRTHPVGVTLVLACWLLTAPLLAQEVVPKPPVPNRVITIGAQGQILEGQPEQTETEVVGVEGEEEGPNSGEPDDQAKVEQEKAGANLRALAAQLTAAKPVPVTSESLELSTLELELGRYEELIQRLDQSLQLVPPRQGQQLPVLEIALLRNLADAHTVVGGLARAEEIYQHLATHFDDLRARSRLARLLERRGERESSESIYYGLIRTYNERPRLNPGELVAVAEACRELGRNNPQLFQDALKALDQVIARAGSTGAGAKARIALTDLFVEKYDSPQARDALQPLITAEEPNAETLLAAARVERFDGRPTARDLALTALEINPNFIEALVFLASLENEAEDRVAAAEFTERALAVNPDSLEALTVKAGLEFLAEDSPAFEAVRDRVLALHPSYADFFVELSLIAMRNRLYPPAQAFAQQAVDLDEKSWRGWGELGLNQLRLGAIDEGRTSLEKAFGGDPFNVWNKNTLDLLDQLPGYKTVTTKHFEIVLHPEEAELLGPIVGDLAERSYTSLAARYAYEPETPIRLEVYPSHEDFSVRTVGLSGLGALGVSFGPVIAIDSPAARGIGDFNWGTTLWHEIAHTFTLGLSKGKIPRWLTEGLSVYEERQGPKGWTDDPSPDFLAAYTDGRLLGLRAMNDGFVRPSFPNQIGLSYFQASLVAEYIDKTWGFDRIVEMLKGYGDGKDTEQIVQAEFDLTLEQFDERFWAYLDERFALTLPTFRTTIIPIEPDSGQTGDDEDLSESPAAIHLPKAGSHEASGGLEQAANERTQDFRAQLAYGQELQKEKRWQEAREYLDKARDLFPEYAGPGSPYHSLAAIALELDEKQAATEALRQLVDLNEYDYEAHLQLADLYEELARPEDELEILGRSIFIYPYRPDVHERIGELALELGKLEQRVGALKATLSLRPSSRPRLLFELATTYRDLGSLADAKRSVLGALEVAPSYAQAQTLLLELIDADVIGGDS